ncbi:sulfite exporter TauE/SafE family protein [Methyloligella solikamskensis]|uniref:Probable membrane transporter protein n=1 Tax=Methyloligella solikamskensis TaxID=1177756 RepID=A0ABW3JCA9_9HYPH
MTETIGLDVFWDFTLFAAVGFLAQLVDGSLGMAYGVVSTTVLLSFGVPPANASASVHVAELFTTGASGASHLWNRNVDTKLFWRLAPAGIVGGILGTYLLTSIDGNVIKPFIVAYMAIMAAVILWRSLRRFTPKRETPRGVSFLGLVGGFVDAVGGGGWGPVVTSSLVGAGGVPRYVIGTVNTAEFLLTAAVSASFVVALFSGHWEEGGDLANNAAAVAGLIVGGLVAAPVAGYAVKHVAPRALGIAVGVLILLLVIFQAAKLAAWI